MLRRAQHLPICRRLGWIYVLVGRDDQWNLDNLRSYLCGEYLRRGLQFGR